MKPVSRFTVSLLLLFAFVANTMPCGPSFVSPLFTVSSSPEHPYQNYANGKIGIVKPTFHRNVLFAAYRWINGAGFNTEEQKAMIDVWNADFKNKDYIDSDVTEAVKAWVEKRKVVVGKDEKVPSIYVEREYGGYDFFPNCTKNAFEIATETLSSRIASNSSESKDVKNWLAAQDAVFSNCSSGKTTPDELQPGAPEWLQKDREYQLAAASFYSLDYEDAKTRFAAIAQDMDSPWRETADYLVARTLIRQASLSKNPDKIKGYYEEAEQHLLKFTGGKFADSAEGMLGLIKYRLRPEERVRELAQKLSGGGGPNFRQDVIDYTWLMDKFEKKVLEQEEAKRQKEKAVNANSDVISGQTSTVTTSNFSYVANAENTVRAWANSARDIEPIANSAANAANVASNVMANVAGYSPSSEYEGGYYGDEEISLSKLPEFLRYEDLTDWLFTYQIGDNEAYLHALNRYKQTGSNLWLMTALSKAKRSSFESSRLLEAANRASRSSLAYPTIAFHAARLDLELGKNVEAKKMIDEALSHSSEMPVSSVNEFMKLRQSVAETLDDFLRYSLRKPYAFDYGGDVGTIDEFIEEQKTWYDPKYNKDGKEAYEAEIEKQFANDRKWQDRLMIGSETINLMNQLFPTSVLSEIEKSEILPDYLRERFAVAIWTRAALLNDPATLNRIAPKLVQYHPELADQMKTVTSAAGPTARQNAILALIVKNPIFTPFLEDGLGKTDNDVGEFDMNDYWCEPYDEIYDDELGDMVSRDKLAKPKFLTPAQIASANVEREKFKKIGNAPTYLGEQVLAWAKRSPNDKRLPEALYLMFRANGWTKYGCGNNEELQQKLGDLLKRRYPNSEWTNKLTSDEASEN